MADSLMKPPSELDITDGNISENFRKWKRQMEVYLAASGASKKGKETQTAIILHCAGAKVIDVYDQIQWGDDENKNDPETVWKHIESFCNPRENEVIESYRFWNVKSEEYTSFEHFLTEIRKRAESCKFAEKDRMLRDKIVFSSSGKLQELLLREENLTLDRAVKIGRAYEQSNKHVKEIRESKSEIHKVDHDARPKAPGHRNAGGARPKSFVTKQATKNECAFCGYMHEFRKEKCPAWGKQCTACNGRNHFRSKCKRVFLVEQNDKSDNEDEFWLSMVQAENRSKVTATMEVNQCDVKFQVDTGAEINTINQKYVRTSQVTNESTKLRMWNKTVVNSLGKAFLRVKNPQNGEEYNINFVVVPNQFQCLLGLKTVQTMNLVTINAGNFIAKVEKDLGDLGEVRLKVNDNMVPKALPARNIPIAIRSQVKEEIDSLEERGILVKMTEPTEWVNQMAVVRKDNGKIRICIDPQQLNKALVRERYRLPTFDDILPELNQAKIFTKLDVKEAFWHVKLDNDSSKLTTMITPFGRYRWTRLPFGLSVSSEIFQRKLQEALNGLDGIFTIADDIIVAGCGESDELARKDNEQKLKELYCRCDEQNIILNDEKTDMGKCITFHGHKITDQGVLPDESKIEAALNMPTPEDVSGVRRFCGLVQYMARFLPRLTDTLEPLRNLTRKSTEWNWSPECEQSFQAIKEQLTQVPVLAYFDSDKDIVIQVDISKDGIGAVLLQDGRPVEYASRSLSDSERKWAQIEKEALAVLYGLERFDQYTYARKVVVQNDHKPLENILKKPVSQAPKRLQDIIMKLHRYDFDFQFMRGEDLVIADTLSRAFNKESENEQSESRARILSLGIFEEFPDARICEIRKATEEDRSLCELRTVILEKWPEKEKLTYDLKQYFSIRDTLSVESGIILKGEAILIPNSLRKDMLKRLHSTHLGYDSLCRRARGTIFWIGMYSDIKEMVKTCEQCEGRNPKNQREPLRQHSDGKGPWDKIGTDLFMIENRTYLLVIDYFTNFIEVDSLSSTSANAVIGKLKKQFCRFGIPREIVSDGGPQYTSTEFQEFVKEWGISHHITSPGHPNSNGKAESGVKIMKNLMMKCAESGTDMHEAFLEQRNTPRQDTGLSPAQMMYGWKARTNIPTYRSVKRPCKRRQNRKMAVKRSYDKRSSHLSKLRPNQSVYFQHKYNNLWQKGQIVDAKDRNYVLKSENGAEYRRNRVHLRPTAVTFRYRDMSPPRMAPPEPPVYQSAESEPVPPSLPQSQQERTEQTIEPERLRQKRITKRPIYLNNYVT